MEYSKDNTMTRKEYLKSKKKNNFWLSKIKYILLIIVVVLLGVYVFKQLNVYNNVTKLANKVVEEAKLARTMTMYYVSEPYTKDGNTSVMLYKSYDESRTIIEGTQNFSQINVIDGKLYGICDKKLFVIDLTTNVKTQLTDKLVEEYQVDDQHIYLRLEDGIYKHKTGTNDVGKIIDEKVHQMIVKDNELYVIAPGKTSKSIIRYNLNGKKQQELSEKYIVSNMTVYGDDIYFINSKDSRLYIANKNGDNIEKVLDNKIEKINNIIFYKDIIYYINKDDSNTLYMYNTKTQKQERVIKKNLSSVQVDGSIIYYTVSGAIGIYKYDITTGRTAQITSARTSEYICIN